MNFDNLMHYDLMTALYRFTPFPSVLLFDFDYSLHSDFNAWKNLKSIQWSKSEVRRANRDLKKESA